MIAMREDSRTSRHSTTRAWAGDFGQGASAPRGLVIRKNRLARAARVAEL